MGSIFSPIGKLNSGGCEFHKYRQSGSLGKLRLSLEGRSFIKGTKLRITSLSSGSALGRLRKADFKTSISSAGELEESSHDLKKALRDSNS